MAKTGASTSTPARRLLTALALIACWAAVAVPVAALVFANSSRTTVVATHEAVVSPTWDGWASIDLGPVLPSFRYPTGTSLGADISLGKTSAVSYEELIQRYALLASNPQGQIVKVSDALGEMAVAAALTGTLAGLLVPAVWLLLGRRRRAELLTSPAAVSLLAGVVVLGLVGVAAVATRPWDDEGATLGESSWQPVAAALPDVAVPPRAERLEVDATLLTQGTKRLVESALASYRTSSAFYDAAAQEAAALALQLRQPTEGETVALLVSDRHDNIGMDSVARAVGDAGGASVLLVGGDDTSTGSSWEAFSLESLDEAFDDYDARFLVTGNHDAGPFVPDQAEQLGFTVLDGEVVDGPQGLRLLGVGDPRSSGLGSWRDESDLSFDEVRERLGETACAADADDERVPLVLVHDANLGRAALEQGCVDLVVGGHLHVVRGPEPVLAGDRVGWSYTTGSTGGAAYAIAIGSKPRRDAVVSLLTFRDGRPVGVQWVALSPLGDYTVGDYTSLEPPEEEAEEGPDEEPGEEPDAARPAG